jgi:hypothetical protein
VEVSMSNLLLFPLREEGELICISQSISWLIGALKNSKVSGENNPLRT